MTGNEVDPRTLRIIAPSLGGKFSGINASMIAVLPQLAQRIGIAGLGFHLPEGIPQISFCKFVRHCWVGPWRIWHARRNIDMLVGLILRCIFRFRLILLFTSAAQRTHSWITRFYYRRMDGLIATTSAAASFLEREALVVLHGVDTKKFSPPEDRSAAWARSGLPGKYGLGIFGRIRPQKGSEDFIDAVILVLPNRPDWTAVIIGQTTSEFLPFERRLRKKVAAAGLADRIRFVGFVPRPEAIPDWYKSMTVVVCASRREGFGLSCLEAMSSGCAVVGTRTGAWPELISDGKDGWLVPPGDPDALAGALMRVTEDPDRALLMGRQAREKVVRNFDIGNEVDGIQSVYRKLLAERGVFN